MLDRCTIPKHEKGIYDNEQLAQLVKYHERKEKHGGNLGPDAGRIMRGAIELDGRTMEKAYSRRSLDNGISKLDGVDDNIDLEMSIVKDNHSAIKSEIIVPWTAVKYILIGEEVNEAFMLKIKVWGYSRLPVVGNADGRDDSAIMGNAWNGNKVFGFLHIKVSAPSSPNLPHLRSPTNDGCRRTYSESIPHLLLATASLFATFNFTLFQSSVTTCQSMIF